MPDETRRVYSTDGTNAEGVRPGRSARADASSSRGSRPGTNRGAAAPPTFPDDGFVRIRREKSGRGGKTVTAVYGVTGTERDLDDLLKALKQRCGAGGSREGRTLEIQGDHRDKVEAELIARGHRVKHAGG